MLRPQGSSCIRKNSLLIRKHVVTLLRLKEDDFGGVDIAHGDSLRANFWQLSERRTGPQIFVDGSGTRGMLL